MDRLSVTELRQLLDDAAQQVQIGGRYAHYKDPNKIYRVTGLVIIEASNQVGVVYAAEYAELSFMRPLSSWLEKIDLQGESVSRFVSVEK